MTNSYCRLLSSLLFAGALIAQLGWESEVKAQQTPTPSPKPAYSEGYHLHDALYMRMSIGVGGLWSTSTDQISKQAPSIKRSGVLGSFDFMLGGTPTPGLVLGGAYIHSWVAEPKLKEGDQPERSAGYATIDMGMLGPMIDLYPVPTGGFHLGGMLGWGTFDINYDTCSFQDNSSCKVPSEATYGDRYSKGGGGAVWIGYDAWIDNELSLGGMLRYAGLSTVSQRDAHPDKDTVNSISLMFTALYH